MNDLLINDMIGMAVLYSVGCFISAAAAVCCFTIWEATVNIRRIRAWRSARRGACTANPKAAR